MIKIDIVLDAFLIVNGKYKHVDPEHERGSHLEKKAIVTGGAGFIGSHLVRILLARGFKVLNIDNLCYAGNEKNLFTEEKNQNYTFLKADIADFLTMQSAFNSFKPDVIFHLAAESHVDRSIHDSDAFIHSNIVGTHTLLKVAREYVEPIEMASFRFMHVSTDEVYGSLSLTDPAFTEETPYNPNSPYSASKAASDHLARAWFETHKLPVIITHCSNNYGPNQYPEKLIPLMITNAVNRTELPVYGNGKNVRDWIHVQDHCYGLIAAYEKGKAGQVYNFGGNTEIENIAIVNEICKILDSVKPKKDNSSYQDQIRFVTDRKGHDFRYAIDNSKANTYLGWKPQINFVKGLKETIEWYLTHQTR